MANRRYRINEIKLKIGEPLGSIPGRIEKKYGFRKGAVAPDSVVIKRESIDARDKADIRLVYSVDFEFAEASDEAAFEARKKKEQKGPAPKGRSKSVKGISEAKDVSYADPVQGSERMKGRPVVVGFGPAGIFAALTLAKAGYMPLVIERGSAMDKRVADVEAFRESGLLDPESNVLFGEGGAGTFSDGKLTSGIRDPRVRSVLAEFASAGAGDDILYKQRPHIGTDVLRDVIVNIRKEIISLGGDIIFDTRLDAFGISGGRLSYIDISTSSDDSAGAARRAGCEELTDKHFRVPASALILAIGHSARDTFRMIYDAGFEMEQKPFSIGVRIEHPQELIDRAQYGEERRLPPAEYKLAYHTADGRGVYSFCMCPGGEVIVCSTNEGELCVNGMSNRKRDSGTANSGILCDVRPDDLGSGHALAGVEFQEKYERLAYQNGKAQAERTNGREAKPFTPPSCSMKEFLSSSAESEPVRGSMPAFASASIREAVPYFASKIKGYDMDDARVTAVETRSSSPLRILRNEEGIATFDGIYPAGEGPGYAGGITSAACDGIRMAEKVIERFAPPLSSPRGN